MSVGAKLSDRVRFRLLSKLIDKLPDVIGFRQTFDRQCGDLLAFQVTGFYIGAVYTLRFPSCSNTDAIWEGMRDKTRNAIRRSQGEWRDAAVGHSHGRWPRRLGGCPSLPRALAEPLFHADSYGYRPGRSTRSGRHVSDVGATTGLSTSTSKASSTASIGRCFSGRSASIRIVRGCCSTSSAG